MVDRWPRGDFGSSGARAGVGALALLVLGTAVSLAACGPTSMSAQPHPIPPGDVSAPPAAIAGTSTEPERPVDVLAVPTSSHSTPRAPVATASVAPATPPLDPPCKLTKGASFEPPDFAPPIEIADAERSVLALPGSLAGRISPEIIQRPVRGRFACFQGCYRRGLDRRPDLEGRVVVGFTIAAASGHVVSVADRGSTLPDKAVIGCILEEMKLVRFPAPVGKDVHIVYPLTFVSPEAK